MEQCVFGQWRLDEAVLPGSLHVSAPAPLVASPFPAQSLSRPDARVTLDDCVTMGGGSHLPAECGLPGH